MTHTIQTLLKQLTILKSKNDWLGIYNKFKPITDLPQNDLNWNNPKVLSDIGFACTMLARTDSIPREIFRDQNALNNFLKKQAEYRKYAQLIQKRCTELEPQEPLHLANFAYIYYQNINDLTQQRGRRDGNLREEIENFITAIDKVLILDSKRVNDLYRKGRILTRILPDQILWSKSYEDYGDFAEKLKRAYEIREEGIQTLLHAKNEWEKLSPDNRNEQYWRKRYRKNYIKALYTLSQVYYDKIKEHCWDESVFTLNLRDDIPVNHQVAINTAHKENITLSIHMIKACCISDCPPRIFQDVKQNQQSLEKIAAYNGEEEGVDKLYSIGKVFFAKYWILSGYGLKETADAIEARETAERYLQAALKCQWSPQKANQHKLFIVERLARIFISKGDYNQAASIIEENTQNLRLEYAASYVLHTCALALLKSGRISASQKVLDIAAKSKGNRHIWSTRFLMGCTYLEENQIEDAKRQFDLAHQETSRVGKKNIDSLLIAKAFVTYKSGDVRGALKFLEEAQRLNPNRVSTSERIQKWKQSEN